MRTKESICFIYYKRLEHWQNSQPVNHYIPAGTSPTHPDISPLHATDLASLPPAYVVTAGYDPLRDEGRAYAKKLRAAGVAVEYHHYPEMIHGFFGFQPMVEAARQAVQDAGQALARALA